MGKVPHGGALRGGNGTGESRARENDHGKYRGAVSLLP
jgi:hypothetical protein